jgi:hypothetical protein
MINDNQSSVYVYQLNRNKNLLSIVINDTTIITSVQLLISHRRVFVFSLFSMIQTKLSTIMRLRACRLITRSCRSVLSVVAIAMKRFPSLNTSQRRRSFTRVV